MNSVLPAGVESYLKEAGFSSTEMLILRKLVEEDSFTLRELASKTGKSTGVLDQAMKKLLNKKIARKEVINDQPRYSIDSLDAVVRWMEGDRKQRKEMIDRKHQNFESFIASLKHDKNRPDMEYFQALEGVEKAYMKLLEPGEELLTFLPAITTDSDPLRAFRVEYFRRRQVRKIFQRILTPDTPLARRFQSRDAFEYRKTLLLPEAELSQPFEKTIVDGTIACINFTDQTACFLKYPDLAASERAQFESLWNRQMQIEKQSPGQSGVSIPEAIPLKTQMLSTVREFLLGPKSVAAFAVFTFLAIAVTFGLYKNNESLNFQRMQDKVIAIATTGAMQIDARDLDQLRVKEDYLKPNWANVVNILKDIRVGNTDIMYVYIFRKSMADGELEFVADSHSLNPFANTDGDPTNDQDTNDDAQINGTPAGGDYLQWPGQPYPDYPAVVDEAFRGVTASQSFYEDQWGKVVTGYAPLKDSEGKTVAVLAVDIKADKLQDLTKGSFFPLVSFLILFVCFVVARVVVY